MKQETVLQERKAFICHNGSDAKGNFKCDSESVAGSVSQRACVYCGARVVLNPITDAYHLVHGPIGCAAYTWDIRGSLSSGEETYRNSFSTDLSEQDVIFGGEKKLTAAIDELVLERDAKLIFVYATCIVGVIGDDLEAVCKEASKKHNITVIPVQSPGFAGHKSMGYKAACNALMRLMGEEKQPKEEGINFLGDFNLAGEMWILTKYFDQIGLKVVSKITGDAKSEELKKAPSASLNIVQCAGSMTYLAKRMEESFDIPFTKVSFFGLEDTAISLMNVAEMTGNSLIMQKAKLLIQLEQEKIKPELLKYRQRLKGKKVAIFVGGGFKAISLVKQFKELGMETVVIGTQTGKAEDYEVIRQITNEGTVILDDTNPYELEKYMKEKKADILVGGVKERPLAYKLGIAFCDHNHERKHPLAGFVGAINFAKEIDLTVNHPIWSLLNA